METPPGRSHTVHSIRRRDVQKAGLAAGAVLPIWLLLHPRPLWGAEAGPHKLGGILCGRGYDQVHFDYICFRLRQSCRGVVAGPLALPQVRQAVGEEVACLVSSSYKGTEVPAQLMPCLRKCLLDVSAFTHELLAVSHRSKHGPWPS